MSDAEDPWASESEAEEVPEDQDLAKELNVNEFLKDARPSSKLTDEQRRNQRDWTKQKDFVPHADRYPLHLWKSGDVARHIFQCTPDQKFTEQAFEAHKLKLTGRKISKMSADDLADTLLMDTEDAEELYDKFQMFARKAPDAKEPEWQPADEDRNAGAANKSDDSSLEFEEGEPHFEEIREVDDEFHLKISVTCFTKRMKQRGVALTYSKINRMLELSGPRKQVLRLKKYIRKQLDSHMREQRILPKQSFEDRVYASGGIDTNTKVYGLVAATVKSVSGGVESNAQVIQNLVLVYKSFLSVKKFRPVDWQDQGDEVKKLWTFVNGLALLITNLIVKCLTKTSAMGAGMKSMNVAFERILMSITGRDADVDFDELAKVMEMAIKFVKDPHTELMKTLKVAGEEIQKKLDVFIKEIVSKESSQLKREMQITRDLEQVNSKFELMSNQLNKTDQDVDYKLRSRQQAWRTELEHKAKQRRDFEERKRNWTSASEEGVKAARKTLKQFWQMQEDSLTRELDGLMEAKVILDRHINATNGRLQSVHELNARQITHVTVLMDSSSSVNDTDYQSMKNFIIDLMKLYETIDKKNVFSVVQFASSAKTEFETLKCARAIGKMESLKRTRGTTNTVAALHKAQKCLEAGAYVLKYPKQIVITITDGKSDNKKATLQEANLLQTKWAPPKATFIGVAVGSKDNEAFEEEIKALSTTTTTADLVVRVATFHELITVAKPEIEKRVIVPMKEEQQMMQMANNRVPKKKRNVVKTSIKMMGFSLFSSERICDSEVGKEELRTKILPALKKEQAELDTKIGETQMKIKCHHAQVQAKRSELRKADGERLTGELATKASDKSRQLGEEEDQLRLKLDRAAEAVRTMKTMRKEMEDYLSGRVVKAADGSEKTWETESGQKEQSYSQLLAEVTEWQVLAKDLNPSTVTDINDAERVMKKILRLRFTVEAKLLLNKRKIRKNRQDLTKLETAVGLSGEVLRKFLESFDDIQNKLVLLAVETGKMKECLQGAFSSLINGPMSKLLKKGDQLAITKAYMKYICKALNMLPDAFDAPHQNALLAVKEYGRDAAPAAILAG